MVFLCCWLSSAACPPSGHHGRMEDTHLFTYIFYMISSYQIFCWWHFGVVLFFPALFMRHLLHVCSVCPGGGIPPLWLSLESQVWGQRTSLTVQIVKPAGGMWLWFWAIWIKLIWFIPWSVCVELDDVWCVQMFCDTRWWWVHWQCCYFVLVCKDNRREIHNINSWCKILWDRWIKVISIWWNHDVPILKMSQGCSPDCLLSYILELWFTLLQIYINIHSIWLLLHIHAHAHTVCTHISLSVTNTESRTSSLCLLVCCLSQKPLTLWSLP